MAKIKKIIEEGSIQYPATITDAVKNPNNGKTVTQELSELGQEVDDLSAQVNGGLSTIKVIQGNGTDIYIPIDELGIVPVNYQYFKISNPPSNVVSYGFGLSSDGADYTYKTMEWVDEIEGIGRIGVMSGTTHIVISSLIKSTSKIIFLKETEGIALVLQNEIEARTEKDVIFEDDLKELHSENWNLDVQINGGKKEYLNIQCDGNDKFIPLSELRTTDFKVVNPSANFQNYGFGLSSDGVSYTYVGITWTDEDNGLGKINDISGATHIVVTSANKVGTYITFFDVEEKGLVVSLSEKSEAIRKNTLELHNIDVQLNGGKKIIKEIYGTSEDIYIPIDELGIVPVNYQYFKISNPPSNVVSYGFGLSSDGVSYTYKVMEWVDESEGLGRVGIMGGTTHLVVTSSVKDSTLISFYDSKESKPIQQEVYKINQRINGGRIIIGTYEGKGSDVFIKKDDTGLYDTAVHFVVNNPPSNFDTYGFATSEDGVTLKSYISVVWIDQSKGYGYVYIDTDYLAITSAVKTGTQIAFLSPDYNGEHEIFAHDAIVSFIDDDTGRYVPEIWDSIIEQTGIKMGFACVAGVISGEVNASSDAYQPMTIDELRTLYNDGHEVYSHTWSHPACYSEDVTPAMLQEEFRRSKDWLNENGFTRNSEVIVYSGGLGENQTEKQNVARRHYKYGVDTVGGGINTEPLKNKLCIYRINADTFTLEELIAKVDKAIEEKKLLVLMNHAYELNKDKENQINKMITFINYIKTTNATILPLHEALHQIYGW